MSEVAPPFTDVTVATIAHSVGAAHGRLRRDPQFRPTFRRLAAHVGTVGQRIADIAASAKHLRQRSVFASAGWTMNWERTCA